MDLSRNLPQIMSRPFAQKSMILRFGEDVLIIHFDIYHPFFDALIAAAGQNAAIVRFQTSRLTLPAAGT